MITLLVGVCILVGILVVVYLMRFRRTELPPQDKLETTPITDLGTKKVSGKDIVLAAVTSSGGSTENALMWNAPPGEEHRYTIHHGTTEIVNGTSTSASGLYIVKALPLQYDETYIVSVDDTTVTVRFAPPLIDTTSLKTSALSIECRCSVVPTDIEAVVAGIKLPISKCQLRIEPPGFIVNTDDTLDLSGTSIAVYNGENACSILLI